MLEKILIENIEKVIYRAGDILKGARLTENSISQKEGPANFVTKFDVEIQDFLISNFKQLIPEATYYGEEDTEEKCADISKGYVFFIDPIDGTTNFMFGYNNSCISVGLSYNGTIVAGFVYNPYTDEMYRAVRGEGSYLNGKRLSPENKSIEDGIVAFGCARYNESHIDIVLRMLKTIFMQSLSIRNGGSAAIDLCRVASGANISYFELKLQPYDYAAASIIIEEAGGIIQQFNGKAITLDAPCSIISGSVKAVSEIINIYNSCCEEC